MATREQTRRGGGDGKIQSYHLAVALLTLGDIRASLPGRGSGGAGLAATGSADAQQVTRFNTYGEAVSKMLGLGLSVGANPTCRLGGDLTAGISDRLMQHCSQDDDGINGGASLGGSLLSSQPTRTVSQFITRRDRLPCRKEAPARQGFAPGAA